eukprot:14589675-Alexandrium_andersonii.AAC.1
MQVYAHAGTHARARTRAHARTDARTHACCDSPGNAYARACLSMHTDRHRQGLTEAEADGGG